MNTVKKDRSDTFERLHAKAQSAIAKDLASRRLTHADVLALIDELQIHQVELEIQNEELKRAQNEMASLYSKFAELYEFAPCGYLNLDAKGIIRRINIAGVALLGQARDRILHQGFRALLAMGYQGLYISTLKKAGRTGEKQGLELLLAGAEGPERWVWAEIEPKRDADKSVVQYRMTLADISSRKEVEAALQTSENRYRNLFNAMVSGAAVFEIAEKNESGKVTDIRFVAVNRAFEQLTGVGRNQVKGKTLRQLWPDTEPAWLAQIDRVLNEDRAIAVEGFHGPLNKHLLFSAFKLDDTPLGATFSDISERVQMEEALKKEARYLETKVRDGQAAVEDANVAVKVLLKQCEKECQDLEEKIVCNLNEMTRPHLERLAATRLSQQQQKLLEAVSASLDDITSPLSRRFLLDHRRLTPTESRVAGLIRQGKATKEIAMILGVATSTIDFHRHNLRRKLGIDRGVNLQSFLNSVE